MNTLMRTSSTLWGGTIISAMLFTVCALLFSTSVKAENAFYDYRHGLYKKAYPNLKALAKNKNKKALFYLGMMKLHGYVVPRNEAEGLRDIKSSAEKGYTQAEKFMGAYYLEVGNQPDKALFWYKRAAAKNDMLGVMYTASAYLNGYGVKKNRDMARRYITKAAQAGNALAQYELAEMFLASKHRRSKRLGVAWLKKSAKQGNQRAEFKLAKVFREGKLLGRNYHKAEEWFNKAKAHNHTDTNYLVAKHYLSEPVLPERTKAISAYQRAIENGHRDSKYQLGLLYLSPSATEASKKEAFELIESAASLGHVGAQHKLASMYEKGEGVKADPSFSETWKKEANTLKKKELKRNTFAWLGRGDKTRALFDKEKAAGVFKHWNNEKIKQSGTVNSNPGMEMVDKTEIFVPSLRLTSPNDIKMYDLFKYFGPVNQGETVGETIVLPHYTVDTVGITADVVRKIYGQARLGNREAQFKMGQFHEEGIVVEKSIPLAMAWYQEAADQNNLKAEYNIALIYLKGAAGEINYGKALYWLNRSAFKGNEKSQYALARIYETGIGDPMSDHSISKDISRSKSMYTLAANSNSPKAKYKLANFLDNESGLTDQSVKDRKKRHRDITELYEEASKAGIGQANMPLAFYYASSDVSPDKHAWAYEIANKAASQGHEKAALLVGLMNDRGIGVEKNRNQAVSWYETALEKNNVLAQFILGTYYFQGDGVSQFDEKANRLLKQASDKSLPYADYNLAVIQFKNSKPFLSLMRKAAYLNYNKASLYLADDALLNNNVVQISDAVDVYQNLGKLGYAKPLLKLGFMYDRGIHFKKNSKKAEQYYLRSAKENNPLAQYLLGNMYQLGKLGKPDIQKATYWYQKAAKNHFVPAYLALGYIAESFQQNYALAKQWYQKAADANSGMGQFNLALMYDYGKGGGTDLKEALRFYELAANNNVVGANLNVANKYLKGIGTSRDTAQAYDWFKKAAKEKDPEAIYQLGLMYEAGVGTTLNMGKAIQSYIRSADKGNSKALLALARIYQSGLGVDVDKTRALKLYEKVALTGNKFAKFQVAKLYLTQLGDKKETKKAKTILQQLGKKDYQPAIDALKQLGEDKLLKERDNDNQVALTKTRLIIEQSSAPLMYIEAIKELNQGDTYQSKAVLKRIIKKFPDYQPAKQTFKRLQENIEVVLPPKPAVVSASVEETQKTE